MAHPAGVTSYVQMVGKSALTPGFRRYYEQRYEGSALPSLGGWGSYSAAEQKLFHEHGDVAVAVKGGRQVNVGGTGARPPARDVIPGYSGQPIERLEMVAPAPNLGFRDFLGGVIGTVGGVIKDIIPGNIDDRAIDWIQERVTPSRPQIQTCAPGYFRQGNNCVPLSTPTGRMSTGFDPRGGQMAPVRTTRLPTHIPTGIGPGAGIFDPLGIDLFTPKPAARQTMPQVAGGLPTPYFVETTRSECAPMPNGSRAVLYYSPMTQQEFCLPPGSQLAKASGLVRKWKPRAKAKLSAHDARMMRKYGKGGAKAKAIKTLAQEAGYSCKTR